MAIRATILGLCLCMVSQLVCSATSLSADYFKILLVDAETGRGIPLVELRTTNETRWYTDSAGIVAIDDAPLMGQKVYFSLFSHGYSYPKDSFGYAGVALDVRPGGSATIRLTRTNIAERLYRVTGEGIYRDSEMLGITPPTRNPKLNGLVMGQDTVEATRYRDKIYWFWGDTSRPAYPLGNFHTSGATSIPPFAGGLDPEKGVDLSYFTDAAGFCKEMFTTRESGPIWVGGLCTVRDASGKERLICNFTRMKSLDVVLQRGIAMFNDDKGQFEPIQDVDLKHPVAPNGHPFHAVSRGTDYIYASLPDSVPAPLVRVPADIGSVRQPDVYESFTCLQPGAKLEGDATKLERNADGALIFGWKKGTDAIDWKTQQSLIRSGNLKPQEALLQLRDALTGKTITPASGSVYWNDYRHRWIMIVQELGGTSLLGEIWFAEADTPVGPWVYARKVITHNNYTFYNPTQHPYLDAKGGERIYLEATYTRTFVQNADPTPRYDYNQVMYALNLKDPRLALPVPIYRLNAVNSDGVSEYVTRERLTDEIVRKRIAEIPFFAPVNPGLLPGLIKINQIIDGHENRLATDVGADQSRPLSPLFYAAPPDRNAPGLTPLYGYHKPGKGWLYSTNAGLQREGYVRDEKPLCRVWTSPMSVLPLDWDTHPRAYAPQ